MIFFAKCFKIFWTPHPGPFGMDGRIISQYGFLVIIPLLIMTTAFYIWFYFIHLPRPNTLKLFWGLFSLGLCSSIIWPLLTILTRYSSLLQQNAQPVFGRNIFAGILAATGFINQITLYIILYGICMIIFFIVRNNSSIHWKIKAMRRYPFTLNKIKKTED